MAKHRAVVIGAGRIGAGYEWHDDGYTHAGAYQALKDRVELVGFVEPDNDRATAAKSKWMVPVYEDVPTGLMALRPDVVSVCVQPDQQSHVLSLIENVKAVWCEKPWVSKKPKGIPVQVNYLRRGDSRHQALAGGAVGPRTLIVYGKNDVHTRCHFDDLSQWWGAKLDFRTFTGPCAYVVRYEIGGQDFFFDNGGVDAASCMNSMLKNLLDHVDTGVPLWSPPA